MQRRYEFNDNRGFSGLFYCNSKEEAYHKILIYCGITIKEEDK